MDALKALHSRNSSPRLTGSVDPAILDDIIKAGLRAPDHAQLRPWRLLVVEGEGREELGALFARAKQARDPGLSPPQLGKLKAKPLRAPLVLVVAARVVEHPKVPEVEQLLSAGAAAQNMLLAAHALGLGAMWRTGEMAYDPVVHEGLGFGRNEKIVGFLYIGEVEGKRKPLPMLNVDDFVTRWTSAS